MQSLLTPAEVDDVLRFKPGRSQRLARRDLMPHVTLPDGSIRFRKSDIEELIGQELGQPAAPAVRAHREERELAHA